jgi:hypothetical protein
MIQYYLYQPCALNDLIAAAETYPDADKLPSRSNSGEKLATSTGVSKHVLI